MFINGVKFSLSVAELKELVSSAGGEVVNAVRDCDYCVSSESATLPKRTTKVILIMCCLLCGEGLGVLLFFLCISFSFFCS